MEEMTATEYHLPRCLSDHARECSCSQCHSKAQTILLAGIYDFLKAQQTQPKVEI